MKIIEIDDELYAHIASQTKHIGESASQILRRLLIEEPNDEKPPQKAPDVDTVEEFPAVDADTAQNEPLKVPVEGDILALVNAKSLKKYNSRVEQFIFILEKVYEQQPEAFAKVTSISGKNRTYFAMSKEALLKSGSSINPKAIGNSGYWVVTNNNTAKKISMLSQVLQILGYEDMVVKTITDLFNG